MIPLLLALVLVTMNWLALLVIRVTTRTPLVVTALLVLHKPIVLSMILLALVSIPMNLLAPLAITVLVLTRKAFALCVRLKISALLMTWPLCVLVRFMLVPLAI
jgi:hypothetical protein